MKPPTIAYLSKIYFEAGAIDLLPAVLDDLTVARPLVVTDKGILAAGLIDQWRDPAGPARDAVDLPDHNRAAHIDRAPGLDRQRLLVL